MSATRWWWMAGVIVIAPACRSAVDADRQADESTVSSSSGSTVSASSGSAVGSSGGGGGSAYEGSGGSAYGGSGGGAYGGEGGAAPSFCTYTVSGAIEATVTDSWPYYYGGLDCSAGVEGGEGYLSVDLHTVTGPGSYPLVGPPTYELQFCADGQDCDTETFSGTAWSCGAEITIAPPVVPTWGERIAGTMTCTGLVNAADPTEALAVTATFSFVMPPPPCRTGATPGAPQ
jgi:hypothetical protein